MTKEKKLRAEKHDTKLAINGMFGAVIKASVIPMPKQVQSKEDKPKKQKWKSGLLILFGSLY